MVHRLSNIDPRFKTGLDFDYEANTFPVEYQIKLKHVEVGSLLYLLFDHPVSLLSLLFLTIVVIADGPRELHSQGRFLVQWNTRPKTLLRYRTPYLAVSSIVYAPETFRIETFLDHYVFWGECITTIVSISSSTIRLFSGNVGKIQFTYLKALHFTASSYSYDVSNHTS